MSEDERLNQYKPLPLEELRTLCVCRCGHSRSVAMTRVLHHYGLQASPVGYATAPSILRSLCESSHRIFIMEASMMQHIPEVYRDKVTVFDVGQDRWVNGCNSELFKICEEMFFTYEATLPECWRHTRTVNY